MGIKPTFAAEVLEDLTLRFINPAKIKQHLLPLKGQLVMITAENSASTGPMTRTVTTAVWC